MFKTSLLLCCVIFGAAACGGVDIGDGSDDDTAPCDPCGDEGDDDTSAPADDDDATTGDDDDTSTTGDDDATADGEWSDYVEASGFVVSFSDDGFSDDVYLADAFMVGYGDDADFGYNLNFPASNVGGRFAFNTSGWEEGCYLSSLISSLQVTNEGGGDYSYEEISSWDEASDWWDNNDFCESGSPAAEEWCSQRDDEPEWAYFIGFCVTSSGVVPNGDGI